MTNNCSLCFEPLYFFSRGFAFPCKHEIHQSCLASWADNIYRTEGSSAKSFSCPLCRRVTLLPVPHSADRILNWVKQVEKVTAFIGGYGAGIGLFFAFKSRSLRWKLLSSLFTVCFLGAVSVSYKNMIKIITVIYNLIHRTSITFLDVKLHKILFPQSPETQAHIIITTFVQSEIEKFKSRLRLLPFDESERKHLEPLAIALDDISGNKEKLNKMQQRAMDTMKEDHGDLYAQVCKIGGHLLESVDNDDLKNTLLSFVETFQIAYLGLEYSLSVNDEKIAARIALISALQFAKTSKATSPENQQYTDNLLERWQSFCRENDHMVEKILQFEMIRQKIENATLGYLAFSSYLHILVLSALEDDFNNNGITLVLPELAIDSEESNPSSEDEDSEVSNFNSEDEDSEVSSSDFDDLPATLS